MGTLLAVMTGGALGSALRWWVSGQLNARFAVIPPGTLLVNWCGGLLIGLALGYLQRHPGLSPALKLFLTTGLCGGLTTFSTFSAEVVTLLGNGNLGWALLAIGLHLGGSLLLTAAGYHAIGWLNL